MKKLLLLTLATMPFICSARGLWISLNAGASANIVMNSDSRGSGFGINPAFDIRARKSFAKLFQAGAGINVMPIAATRKDQLPAYDENRNFLGDYDLKTFYASPMVSPYLTFGIAPKFKKSTLMIGVKTGACFGMPSDKRNTPGAPELVDGKYETYVDFKTSGFNAGAYIDYVYNIRNVGVGVSFMPTFYNVWGLVTWGYTAVSLPVSVSANIKL